MFNFCAYLEIACRRHHPTHCATRAKRWLEQLFLERTQQLLVDASSGQKRIPEKFASRIGGKNYRTRVALCGELPMPSGKLGVSKNCCSGGARLPTLKERLLPGRCPRNGSCPFLATVALPKSGEQCLTCLGICAQ